MKKGIIFLAFLCASLATNAQWTIDKGHSKFTFKRSDFGIGGKLPTVMVSDEIQIRATGEFQKK